jgi:uncharacterized RDD family membrane protein YckC/DNA-directed RNA polymerase subunit RPC12/RpoP
MAGSVQPRFENRSMPIEFACTQCGKQLRTPDETAGRNAKCPQCGTVMQIPQPVVLAPQQAAFAPLPSSSSGAAAGQFPAAQPATGEFDFNPYQSPTATTPYGSPSYGAMANSDHRLASLGARFGGALLDGIFSFGAMMVGAGIWMFLIRTPQVARNPDEETAFMIAELAGMLMWQYGAALIVAIINWVLITQSGQSLGKKIVGTRIVRMDGSPAGFGYGVAMRSWLPGIIMLIPYLNALFWLVDVLFIFGQERRCIHDQIAGTQVVIA